MVTGPYRTPGREVTGEDRRAAEATPVGPPRPPTPMIDAMIEACTEARIRSRGVRQWMRYRLSLAAFRSFEEEVAASISVAAMEYSQSRWGVAPPDAITPTGCAFRCLFRGIPVFVDPTMIAGWTVEVGE